MQTEINYRENYKYPIALANLPEQIVTADKMIEHIEKECKVSIWNFIYEYMQQYYPDGPPNDLTGVGEAIVKNLKEHPSLLYRSPNFNCIGEYRVQGYEWMRFIMHIRYICNVCQKLNEEDDDNDDEEEDEEEDEDNIEEENETSYTKQQFTKLLVDMNKYISNSKSVIEYMESYPEDLCDVTIDIINYLTNNDKEFDNVYDKLCDDDRSEFHDKMSSILWDMEPKIREDEFNKFINTTLTNFIQSEQFIILKKQDMLFNNKIGKAKGLYFKFINNSTSKYSLIFKMLTKNQKSKLNNEIHDKIYEELLKEETHEITDTPPIELLIGKRPHSPPPLISEPHIKKARLDFTSLSNSYEEEQEEQEEQEYKEEQE